MLAVINAELVLRDHLVPEAYILTEGGIIQEYGSMKDFCPAMDWEILDTEGAYVGPGLIDMHLHAGGDFWFYDEPVKAAEYILKHGSTTVLPTLYFNMNREELVIAKMQEAMKQPGGKSIGGFYMEAPYMNPCYGADRESIPRSGEIRQEEYMDVLKQAGTDVRVCVVAPVLL